MKLEEAIRILEAYPSDGTTWGETITACKMGAEALRTASHWISVEEDLPPYGEQVLVFAEEDPDYEMWWSERYTPEGAKYKGVSSGKVYEIMTDRNGFASMRDENNEPLQVSHWHRIVPPVHSNSENTGKNLKGE